MTEKNVASAVAYYKAMADQDLTGMAQYLHPDVRLVSPMEELTGKEAVLAAVKPLVNLIESIKVHAKFKTFAVWLPTSSTSVLDICAVWTNVPRFPRQLVQKASASSTSTCRSVAWAIRHLPPPLPMLSLLRALRMAAFSDTFKDRESQLRRNSKRFANSGTRKRTRSMPLNR
jgi:SnoaL-like domain